MTDYAHPVSNELGVKSISADHIPDATKMVLAENKTVGKMISDKNKGLYQKFDVRRTDGGSEPGQKHHGCDYFVLDLTHDKHGRAALAAYANACEHEYPHLAADLRAKLSDMDAASRAAAAASWLV